MIGSRESRGPVGDSVRRSFACKHFGSCGSSCGDTLPKISSCGDTLPKIGVARKLGTMAVRMRAEAVSVLPQWTAATPRPGASGLCSSGTSAGVPPPAAQAACIALPLPLACTSKHNSAGRPELRSCGQESVGRLGNPSEDRFVPGANWTLLARRDPREARGDCRLDRQAAFWRGRRAPPRDEPLASLAISEQGRESRGAFVTLPSTRWLLAWREFFGLGRIVASPALLAVFLLLEALPERERPAYSDRDTGSDPTHRASRLTPALSQPGRHRFERREPCPRSLTPRTKHSCKHA